MIEIEITMYVVILLTAIVPRPKIWSWDISFGRFEINENKMKILNTPQLSKLNRILVMPSILGLINVLVNDIFLTKIVTNFIQAFKV